MQDRGAATQLSYEFATREGNGLPRPGYFPRGGSRLGDAVPLALKDLLTCTTQHTRG